MRKILAIFVCLLLSGCIMPGSKSVELPKRVRTLGVLPVLIDRATIEHSNRDGLIALLEETSQDVDAWLIEKLRKKGDYFDVRQIEGQSGELFSQLIAGRSVEAEAATTHYSYSFNPTGVTELVDAHLVDAVLVVIIHGVKRPEKRWSPHSTRLEYLQTEYSSLLYTAVVVAAPADQLWSRKTPAGDFFLRLDYPDFGEAFWNMTDEVRVKEISLPGLQRTLAEREEGLFVKTTIPKKYSKMIRELVDQLKNSM